MSQVGGKVKDGGGHRSETAWRRKNEYKSRQKKVGRHKISEEDASIQADPDRYKQSLNDITRRGEG